MLIHSLLCLMPQSDSAFLFFFKTLVVNFKLIKKSHLEVSNIILCWSLSGTPTDTLQKKLCVNY